MEPLSTEQVLALSPDASSTKAGQALANPAKWVSLGRSGRSVWGECQGSGKNPYRTQADLGGPAFNCSCPSRKFPCKHGLGLLFLYASNPGRVAEAEPPAWVSEWIAKRDSAQEKKAVKAAAEAAPLDPEQAAKRAADREKRAAKREERVAAGLQELQTWLGDLARQGLAHARQQSAQYFDAIAARMIDAQAPGVARRLREWPGLFASGDRWADLALEAAGSIQHLIHGFHRIDDLPDDLRATIRTAIGWNVTDQDLEGAAPVRDRWQIVGQVVEEQERLRVQRTWLIGESSRQAALSLSFAPPGQPLDITLIAGTIIDAELVFHPSAAPLRAAVRERHGDPLPLSNPATFRDFAEALDHTGSLLAGDPWMDQFPWFIQECTPLIADGFWLLRDATGAVVRVSRRFPNAWPLFAASGGAPATVFGEWNGRTLRPLSAIIGDRFIPLGGPVA